MSKSGDSGHAVIIDTLKALAHDVRLTLVRTLFEQGERSVGELETMTGTGQPRLSQQLAILRKAGLVQSRRDSKLVFYRLAPDALKSPADLLCTLAGIAPQPAQAGGKNARRKTAASIASFPRIL